MTDRRPLVSPMPPEAAACGQSVVDRLKPMLDQAFDDVRALPGNPDERQNDALSVIATVGAYVTMQLATRLALSKGIGIDFAYAIATNEIAERALREIGTVMAKRS